MTDDEATVPGDNVLGLVPGYVDRIEKLTEERDQLNTDIKDIYGEAKKHEIDSKALKMLIADRRQRDGEEQQRLRELVRLYNSIMKRAGK
jgi:uncharacterized protein (UPF0335 family)